MSVTSNSKSSTSDILQGVVKFWRRLRYASLWKILFTLASIILLVSIALQSWLIFLDKRYETQKYLAELTTDRQIKLHLVYPNQVRSIGATDSNRSIVSWVEQIPITSTISSLTYTLKISVADKAILFSNQAGDSVVPLLPLSLTNNKAEKLEMLVDPIYAGESITLSITLIPAKGLSNNANILEKNISIYVEPFWEALVRRLVELYLGPTTSLLALVAILGNFGLQKLIEASQEQEKQSRRQRAQKVVFEARQIGTLYLSSPRLAAQQILELRDSINDPEFEWYDENLQEEFTKICEEIRKYDWGMKVLRCANTFNDLEECAMLLLKLAPSLTNKGGTDDRLLPNISIESLERIAAHLIVDYNRFHDLLAGTESKILVVGALKLYEELGEIVVDVLAKLISRIELLHDFHREITNDSLSGKKLLKETKIQVTLAQLQSNSGVNEQQTNQLKQLWNISQALDQWPRLWSIIRPLDSQEIQNCLNLLELQANPFGPEQAELDTDLKDYYYIPSEYESVLKGSRPAIVFGDSGAGKTTLAFISSYWCMNPANSPKEPASFPVYLNLHPEDLDRTTNLDRIADTLAISVGEALLRFIALNPYRFLEHNLASKASIATTLTHTTGSYDNLVNRLHQAGLADHSIALKLIEELRRFSTDQERAKRSHRDWFEILGQSRPAGFCVTHLLIDIHSQGFTSENTPQIATQLNRLIRQVIPLASLGIYVKLFLPTSLHSHTMSAISPGIPHLTIEWTDEQLREMLKARLRWARPPYQTGSEPVNNNPILELNQLFDKLSRSAKPSPEDRFVRAAQNSPRLLVRLGNRLLLQHAKEQPDEHYLTSKDLRLLLDDNK